MKLYKCVTRKVIACYEIVEIVKIEYKCLFYSIIFQCKLCEEASLMNQI